MRAQTALLLAALLCAAGGVQRAAAACAGTTFGTGNAVIQTDYSSTDGARTVASARQPARRFCCIERRTRPFPPPGRAHRPANPERAHRPAALPTLCCPPPPPPHPPRPGFFHPEVSNNVLPISISCGVSGLGGIADAAHWVVQVYNCTTSACEPGVNVPVGYQSGYPLCANSPGTPAADCTLTPGYSAYVSNTYVSNYTLAMGNAFGGNNTFYYFRCGRGGGG